MFLTRHLTPDGASHRRIHIKQNCFLANEATVLAGATLESHSTLGNRAVAMPLTTYDRGVWTGAPAQLLYRKNKPAFDDVENAFQMLVWPLVIQLLVMFVDALFLPMTAYSLDTLYDVSPWCSLFVLWAEPWVFFLWALQVCILIKRSLKGKYSTSRSDPKLWAQLALGRVRWCR
jgi:hypothetical protein